MKKVLLITLLICIDFTTQHPNNANKNHGNKNHKHNRENVALADRSDIEVHTDTGIQPDFSQSTQLTENISERKHGKKNKNRPNINRGPEDAQRPARPKQTLLWKPKPRPKGRPPPPGGFSGFRPQGWGKGGHAYNSRGEKVHRRSHMKYEQYMKEIFGEDDFDENDILTVEELNGRTIAAPGEYPHASAIGIEEQPDPDELAANPNLKRTIDWKCGGSLIGRKFVITAAHCTDFGGEPPTHVEIGGVYLKKTERNSKPQVLRIAEIFIHPYYKEESYYYDIALLRLNAPVNFTRFVRPIRLWSLEDIPYETVFAMGYGATRFGYQATNVLTYLNFTLIGNKECNDTLPSIPETEFGVVDKQVCAIDRKGIKDTCQGDSGGPLQLNLPGRLRPRYSLIGITSYGLPCGSNTPSVYTRTYSYLDWLEDIVWPEENKTV